MTTLWQDIRFAFRSLRRTPAFPLAAITTLALGIGATTAIFSTVNAVLLRPLPYPDSHNLYSLRTTLTDGRVTTGLLSAVEILALKDPALSVERAAALLAQDLTLLKEDGTPLRTRTYFVSEGFFELFGSPMTLGAGFTPEHFVAQGPPVVVVSHRIWRDMFGSDPALVGKPVRFTQFTSTIVGVTSPTFDTPHNGDFWFNMRLPPDDVNHSLEGFARLKPGTTIERVRSELDGVIAQIARTFPASVQSRVYVVRPLVESIVGELGPILVVVLSATALLLILACVNVTNLLLARGAARAREMAVRVALGASRARIVRQLLTESVLLAAAGGLVGVAGAYAGVRGLMAFGASRLPRLDDVPFDSRVMFFALAALMVSGLLVGFAPALRLARTDVRALMNESSRSSSGGRGTARWLSVMTVAEIALAVTLVAGAGWLIRSFANLWAIDPGFASDQRLLVDVSLQSERYRDGAVVVATSTDLLERLRALPGVTRVASTSQYPLRGGQENSLFLEVGGTAHDPARPLQSRQRFVSPGFFGTMDIRLTGGRDFTNDDRQAGPPVVVVNETFVKRNLGGRDALTMRFRSGYPNINPNSEVQIVGVVEDVRQRSLSAAAEPAFYTIQFPFALRRQTIVLETKLADPMQLQAQVRDAVRAIDPQMPVDLEPAMAVVGATLERQQLGMTLMMMFGAAAIALAAVGIYGVIAYSTAQRRNEVATRLALGASSGNVFWLVVKQGRTLTLIGAAIGLLVAYLSGQAVSSWLFEVRASDPVILGLAVLVVVAIALAATVIPAWRASRMDPAHVLRPE